MACPSSSQCTAVDYGGREVTFNPNSPGTPLLDRRRQDLKTSVSLTGNGKALLKTDHGTLHATLKLTPNGGKPTTTSLTSKA